MNFLGHLYLAGQDPLAVVGNFMADAVKGRDLSRFPDAVQQGIRLHRAIDTFTDAHPAQRVGRDRLRPHAGRYSGVVMDLFFDHLLAVDWDRWHPEPLPDFAQRMYALLQEHAHLMPDRTQDMLPYMVRYDWLTSYATTEGLARALHGLSHRVPEGEVMRGAERVLLDHFDDYRNEFGIFLPELSVHLLERT
ncbi:MAG TPA: ACP phosphodiesterase [Flavobacteriales bacterium]|nr:ACP phosphodiesterase [Flavobacteriales bacterium]